MSAYWADAPTEPLTPEALTDAFRAVRDAPPHPCSLGHHVVSSRALEGDDGGYPCMNCPAIVWVKDGRRVS